MYEIARYRQADMIREAERARLAHAASLAADTTQRHKPRTRRRAFPFFSKPALGR
jgi:hypothetical protein